MKQFIDKLIEMLEKLKESGNPYDSYWDETMYRATELVNSTSNKTIDGVIEIVNQLAEEYNNGWIICNSGTMPKENETIMLTFKNSAGLHVGEATYKNRMFFYVTDTEFGYYEEVYKNPIAWKPKDAPYQPKGE